MERIVFLRGLASLWAIACSSPSASLTDAGADAATDDDTADAGPPTLYVENLGDEEIGTGTIEDPFRHLQDAIDAAPSGARLEVRVGTYAARVHDAIDPTCGNCADDEYRMEIPVTIGFEIIGKAVHIVGESRTETVLTTGAGYGVYFENAGTSTIENLTVTGGVRDPDGYSTAAAVFARYTDLRVIDLDIIHNDGWPATDAPIAGVMGVTGREGAHLTVIGCSILNNTWDGIALYRSDPEVPKSAPTALIVHNRIGCTTACVGTHGRGVGIGITWDAQAEIVNNRIHDYWKGIGSFGESQVSVSNNIVEDQHGWGVIATGDSTMHAINNVIAHNGTTGLAAWSETAHGSFINNLVVDNGWNTEEWVGKRTGVWMNAPFNFVFAYNDVWGNETEDMCTGGVPGGDPCEPLVFDGELGSFSADPFVDDEYQPLSESPLIDAGDPAIDDLDGSRSDIGALGGPGAGRVTK